MIKNFEFRLMYTEQGLKLLDFDIFKIFFLTQDKTKFNVSNAVIHYKRGTKKRMFECYSKTCFNLLVDKKFYELKNCRKIWKCHKLELGDIIEITGFHSHKVL